MRRLRASKGAAKSVRSRAEIRRVPLAAYREYRASAPRLDNVRVGKASTAATLAPLSLSSKTIVLTGAMVPYAFGSSDGLFNLGSALSFVQVLPAGVYVAMNGTHFAWNKVRKNRKAGAFESID